MLLFWCAFFGAVSAIVIPTYAVLNIECPYDRVAFYLTIIASGFTASLLGYFLLTHTVFIALSTFMLTKFICWSIFNHKNMVHYSINDPEN